MKLGNVFLKSESLNLPDEIARKLKGKKFELLETKEGILLKLVEDSIKTARGFLKGGRFSSERYMHLKIKEKGLDR